MVIEKRTENGFTFLVKNGTIQYSETFAIYCKVNVSNLFKRV